MQAERGDEEWCGSDLERLGRCPVCGGRERSLVFEGVRDGVFGAPGRWDYHRCACGILYLDPRPTEESIGRAYAGYYTHDEWAPAPAWRAAGFRGNVRRGYLNSRYGYRMRPASLLAGLTWRLRRPAVKNLDYMIRHLPAPGSGGGRVLDAGCGNGDFLRVAEDLGHEAIGIDPDPDAVERARSRGLDARLGHLPGSGLQRGSFDHVFLSHVLEHLHRPAEALSEACALLAPGGRLWLSLPNLEAPGLARFGAGWRGLEPPRHLFLAAPARIIEMLAAAGFEGARLLPAEEGAEVSYRQSLAIASRLDPEGPDEPPGWHEGVAAEAEAANRLARSDPAKGEAVTVVAWRPR